ncbi:inosine-uridine preferring nucleoside hydrolase isoform X2 [Cherax quadricarinatus]|uniref:inosine-uridine preferring nucleoside hydrolase isoform X2 n=1 Tax=Cherax quadricarinatus TaxID=27406 RepID=UPI002379BD81|nr:inosine-uridine preferring nucleoside hydrolase-like isoform X2 [Cherax quadricarinatus]
MMVVPKVIIDTDAGVDDALAIFMALAAHKRKEIEVIAVTTVQGNTEVHNVNTNVLRILNTAALLEIPVYSGATKSLVHQWTHPGERFHGSDGFGDAQLPSLPLVTSLLKPQHAVWALIELVNKYPKEIMLAALGPLTNLALAIRLDPLFTSHLLGIYMMGGNTTGLGNITSSAEFNFMCDPEAARVVLDETLIPIHLTPWEMCLNGVKIPYSQREKMGQMKSPAAELMNKIESNIIKTKEFANWITCDQLAVAWLIDSAKTQHLNTNCKIDSDVGDKTSDGSRLVSSTSSCFATVELNGNLTRGQMAIDHRELMGRTPNLIIMTSLDEHLYLQYLRMAFGGNFEKENE